MSRAELFLRSVAAQQSVVESRLSESDWVLRGGELRHRSADFFRVIGARDHDGVEHLLFDQPETALVGLVVTGPVGRRRVLLNARAEPGLHGGAQFSATVQSTPSNYERRHGGRPTPFLPEMLDLAGGARLVHDSVQYDWGSYYRSKTKRFRIVEVADEPPAPAPLLWVSAQELEHLMRGDRLTTLDLRCILLALQACDAGVTPIQASHHGEEQVRPLEKVAVTDLERWKVDDDGVHDSRAERSIRWFTTTSSTREVSRWTQPLMVLERDVLIPVHATHESDHRLLAAQRGTAVGLEGRLVWNVGGTVNQASTSRHFALSAEGGRFFRHGVTVVVDHDGKADTDAEWLTREEALALCLSDLQTSVEFRLAVGVVATEKEAS